jgi:hypothetical protein
MISSATKPDFPDWHSPMLVKELRQGMRSRVFVSAFYFTQILMILSVAFNLAATSSEDMPSGLTEFLNGLFWFLIALPLLFLMPVRGFAALHAEIKSGTLPLVFLTHLSAWRIAAGKWAALMVQTLLLVCAVLPYVLLRYFLGGIDILDDVQKLVLLFLTSAVLTAVTVAMSPYESKLLRALFVIAMILSVQFLAGILLAWLSMGRLGGGGGSLLQLYVGCAIFMPAFIVLCLEIAASKIAPAAENHALRKRVLALGVLGIGSALGLLGDDWKWAYAVAVGFLVPVIIDALSEPLQIVRTVYAPFYQRGAAGRLAGVFFTPGWPSASWFTLLAALLSAFPLLVFVREAEEQMVLLTMFGSLLFPAVFIRLFMRGTKNFLGFYVGLHFFFGALTLMLGIMSGISNQPYISWLAWIPNCAFLIFLTDQVRSEHAGMVYAMATLSAAVCFGAALLLSLAPLRDIRIALGKYASSDAKP